MTGWWETVLFLDTFSKQKRAWRFAFLRMILLLQNFPPLGLGGLST